MSRTNLLPGIINSVKNEVVESYLLHCNKLNNHS